MTSAGIEPWELFPLPPEQRAKIQEHIAAQVAIAKRAEQLARYEAKEFRDKLAALAALEEFIGESGENAARNIRDLLDGTGEHDNDPRVQARAWGLEWDAPDAREEGEQ